MRRFLVYAVALLFFAAFVLLALDRVNVGLLADSPASAAHKMWRLFSVCPADEIPILGSSRASQNIAPSQLSPAAFNYGMDGSGQGETLLLLEALVARGGSVPIIVNLDPWGFPPSGPPALMGDYRLVLDNPAVRAFLPPEKCRLRDRLPGLRFHGALRPNLAAWLNGRFALTKRIDRGATLQILSRTPKEWAVINATIRPSGFSVDDDWKARIAALARRATRPIVWVVGPCAPRWAKLYEGEPALRAFLDWLTALPNQIVIDLHALPYGEALFMNPTHLNLDGAERFTRVLRAELLHYPNLAAFFGEGL